MGCPVDPMTLLPDTITGNSEKADSIIKLLNRIRSKHGDRTWVEALGLITPSSRYTNLRQDLKTVLETGDPFSTSAYQELKEDRMVTIEFMKDPPNVAVSSTEKCKKCGGNRVTYFQLQTRGGDEGITTFLNCLQCGKRWKLN